MCDFLRPWLKKHKNRLYTSLLWSDLVIIVQKPIQLPHNTKVTCVTVNTSHFGLRLHLTDWIGLSLMVVWWRSGLCEPVGSESMWDNRWEPMPPLPPPPKQHFTPRQWTAAWHWHTGPQSCESCVPGMLVAWVKPLFVDFLIDSPTCGFWHAGCKALGGLIVLPGYLASWLPQQTMC